MPWVAAAIVGSSVIGSDAARRAGNIQADAARNSLEYQKQQYEDIRKLNTGGRAAGASALNQLGALGSGTYGMFDAEGNQIGTGEGSGYLTQQYTPEEFAKGIDPGYQFRLQQGQEATNRMANMGGGMISGNALKGAQDYTQGLASTEFTGAFNRFQTGRQNIYNTLAGIAGLGQNATNTTANASNVASTNVGNTMANLGAAQAGGVVGQANAISGGLQQYGNQQYLSNLLASKNQIPAGYTDASGFANGGSGVLNVPGEGTMSIGNYFRPA
jgi:hypothetical protein